MSYLDRTLTKGEYFQHISTKSQSYKNGNRHALDYFEKFCFGKFNRSTEIVLADLMRQKEENPIKHTQSLFGICQDFIQYLTVNVEGADTIRNYFNSLKKFMIRYGFEIYREQVSAKLNFPKKIEEEKYPLTVKDIEKILAGANEKRRVLYLFLSSSGMRISESLQLRKRDLDLETFERIMVVIPGKYTKTKKPRKTFISKETQKYLEPILKKIKDDDIIFGTNENHLKSKHTEEDYFYRLRERIGLVEKYDSGQHKVTLHSFRSWFVTKCNRIDSDFGNALAGHEKYMKSYNRFSEEEKCQLYIKAESTLQIFDRVDEEDREKILEQSRQISQLTNLVMELKRSIGTDKTPQRIYGFEDEIQLHLEEKDRELAEQKKMLKNMQDKLDEILKNK